jgi:hypothetical protein
MRVNFCSGEKIFPPCPHRYYVCYSAHVVLQVHHNFRWDCTYAFCSAPTKFRIILLQIIKNHRWDYHVFLVIVFTLNQRFPIFFRFTKPLVSQQFFHGAPRPKEIPNTSIYEVVV